MQIDWDADLESVKTHHTKKPPGEPLILGPPIETVKPEEFTE